VHFVQWGTDYEYTPSYEGADQINVLLDGRISMGDVEVYVTNANGSSGRMPFVVTAPTIPNLVAAQGWRNGQYYCSDAIPADASHLILWGAFTANWNSVYLSPVGSSDVIQGTIVYESSNQMNVQGLPGGPGQYRMWMRNGYGLQSPELLVNIVSPDSALCQ